jgi:hypothetical protein
MVKHGVTNKHKREGFSFVKGDFSKENLIEGGLIRPAVMMTAFFTFIIAMFLLLIGDYKWGGSLIIFSFVLNLFSIYESLCDEPSIFKKMNLAFKFVLFIAEIAAFNYALVTVL